ncbi:hypothetical protein NUW58_g619 [Xylaria curta]|uniref:Uncharacterized protein n=1 Tax=Xylaria curta TaxID=42375 RepID=A0ACC1PP35_9PEZI|nr:hypothetical protein NUW58_g619 [Xylaria curta]
MDEPHGLLLCVVDVGLGTDNFMNAAHAGHILIGTPDEKPFRALAIGQCLPDGIDYSAATGQVFWTSMGMPPSLPNGAIFSCDLGGGARRTILSSGVVHTPKQLVVDDPNSKLYICDREGLRVLRCNLDGTDLEVLIKTGDFNREEERSDPTRWCVGVCLSQDTGKIYWSQKGPSKGSRGRIFRANINFLPGEDAENRTDIECLLHYLPEPINLDIDEKSGKIFWTDRGELPLGNSINAVSLDQLRPIEDDSCTPSWPGRDYELLVRNMHEAIGIKLDVLDKYIYATNLGGTVNRFDFDGGNKRVLYENKGTFAESPSDDGDRNSTARHCHASTSSQDIHDYAEALDGNDDDPVVICGMSIKFPQDALTVRSFWEMLVEKRCASTDFPTHKKTKALIQTDVDVQIPLRGGHFIDEDLPLFDADFFSISPAEAAAMDPMQRWLLEVAYKALENAGIPMEKASGSATGVYVGSFGYDYMIQLYRDPEAPPKYAAVGVGLSMLANRLSWFYNFRGPSIGLDTACSSAATALDLACQTLKNGSCDMCLVAGCSLTFSPEAYTSMSNLDFLSPHSRCFSFDNRANGYSRGEGIAVLVLKRLSDAIRDRSMIRAVIRATASNEDGKTPGITQPSREAQERLIHETYRKAGLSMEYTRYFEAHGTGTPIGDPREAQAIGSAFRVFRSPADPLYIGAVKSNIGHLGGASGLAGIIKAVMVLESGIIPPNANFEEVNPKIDAEYLRLKFPTQCYRWPTASLRRASVNSFGYGGANAHAVLDDAYNYLRMRSLSGDHCTLPGTHIPSTNTAHVRNVDEVHTGSSTGSTKLLIWSSSDKQGIDRLAQAYRNYKWFGSHRFHDRHTILENLTYTLDTRRSNLGWRSFALLNSIDDLRSLPTLMTTPVPVRSQLPRIAYVFTGQGAQWYAMGRELMQYSSFMETLKRADDYLRGIGCSWGLVDELLKPQEASSIDQPVFSQTLTTVLQTAIVDLLRSFGMQPKAVLGHSSGEIAAAYAGGHITIEFSWKLAYYRGRCSQELSELSKEDEPGAMLAVGLSEEMARKFLATISTPSASFGLGIASINSPNNVTISGEKRLISQLHEQLKHQGIFTRELRVGVAYHSNQMKQVSAVYTNLIGETSLKSQETKTIMISTVTGRRVTTETLLSPLYWADNLVSPVLFSKAVSLMCAEPPENYVKKIDGSHHHKAYVDVIIEIGPHAALQGPIREILNARPRQHPVEYLSVLRRGQSALETTLRLVGRLHCTGLALNLRAANEPLGEQPRSLLVDLPEYQFDHSRGYWYETRLSRNYRMRENPFSDLLGVRSNDWNPMEARWRHFLRFTDMAWIEQHVVNGSIIYPAAGMLIMAVEASRQLGLDTGKSVTGFSIRDVQFKAAMVLDPGSAGSEVQTTLRCKPTGSNVSSTYDFTIYTFMGQECVLNCEGVISIEFSKTIGAWETERSNSQHDALILNFEDVKEFYEVQSEQMYRFLQQSGLTYGPAFQALENQSYTRTGHAKADVRLYGSSDTKGSEDSPSSAVMHPASLDAIFHLAFTALSWGASQPMAVGVPTHLESMWLSNDGLAWPSHETVRAMLSIDKITKTGFICSGLATGMDSRRTAKLWYDGLELTNVTEAPHKGPKLPNPRQFYMGVDCNPALGMMSSNEIYQTLEAHHSPKTSNSGISGNLEELVRVTLTELVNSPGIETLGNHSPWKENYLNWAHHHLSRLSLLDSPSRVGKVPSTSSPGSEEDASMGYGATGRVYKLISENITAIFRDQVNPVELVLQDNLFADMYEQWFGQNCCARQVSTYMHLLAHQYPGMKILELGGGTGAGTRLFIDALRGPTREPPSSLRCERYDFTDVSPATFAGIKQEFDHHLRQMTFKTLDMELDFTQQGFQHEEYDIIVAASVLHVTANLEETLRNIRKGLKAGGKLIIQEVFETTGWTLGFVFGLLPGWWLGVDDNRVLSPNITKDDWDTFLRRTGFSGIDIVLNDQEQATVTDCGWIISTAINDLPPIVPQLQGSTPAIIVVDKESAHQRELSNELIDPIRTILRREPLVLSLEEFNKERAKTGNDLTISLLDYGSPLFRRLSDRSWRDLQAMIKIAHHILWVSSGGGQPIDPDFGVLDGLARTWRSEHYGLHLVTLALQRGSAKEQSARIVIKVLGEVLERRDGHNYEEEYIEIGGILHTRRPIDASSVKSQVNARLISHRPHKASLKSLAPFVFKSSSQVLNKPHFSEINLADHMVSSGSNICIMIRAVSLQARDRALALKHEDDPSNYGSFSTGFVIKSPPQSPFRAGDRVYVNGQGLLRSKLWVQPTEIERLPLDISYVDACVTIPPMMTVYTALAKAFHFKNNGRVLVQEAVSLIGQAIILLLRDRGFSDIWATALNYEESMWIQQKLDIPSDNILPRTWFQGTTMLGSRWKGYFDLLIGVDKDAPVPRFLECLKSAGHFILFQLPSSTHRGTESVRCAPRTFSTTIVLAGDPQGMLVPSTMGALQQVLRLCSSWAGRGTGGDIATFPASGITDAFDCLKKADSPEVIVVEFDNMDEIEVRVPINPPRLLDSGATYIVAGGLGGLGRSLSRWLVTRGTRNIVLLSRSGPEAPEAVKLLAELNAMGVRVEAPRCDITDRVALKKVLAHCSNTMPPFRGCIQATMVMKEGIFEKLNLEDFYMALGPKVTGSWNLHSELPTGLDFFVLMSSMSGIAGRISLGAYNAGNTYQDALAHYRVALGQSALSIDLGAVENEGYLYGRQSLLSGYQRIVQVETMNTKEIYALLDAHLEMVSGGITTAHLSQQIVGLRPPSHWKSIDDVPFTMSQPFWGHMHHVPVHSEETKSELNTSQTLASGIAQKLATTLTQSEMIQVICTALAQRISSLLGTSEEIIEFERPLNGYGLDSLSAVELRNWIGKTFDTDVSLFDILGEATIRTTGLLIARKRQAAQYS